MAIKGLLVESLIYNNFLSLLTIHKDMYFWYRLATYESIFHCPKTSMFQHFHNKLQVDRITNFLKSSLSSELMPFLFFFYFKFTVFKISKIEK